MTRKKIINILIKDRIHEFVFAACYEGLEDLLNVGWKGFENYTDQELQDVFDELDEGNFDKKTAEKIIKQKKVWSDN